MKPHRAYVDLAHGQVHYAECGAREAPPVLLLHQTPRSWEEYREVLPLLGTRYRAIAMDTAGFGESDPPALEPSIEAWADVASQLLAALQAERAHVVGHHTGGVIAVELAARHRRVRSLVLSSTPYTDEPFRRARAGRPPIDGVQESADGAHLAQLWRNRQGFYPSGRPELLQAFVRDALKVSGDVEAGHRAVAAYRMEERIASVIQPTLVVCATADPFSAPHAQHWRQHLPQAQVVNIDGGMVPLPDQMPEAFAGTLLHFLDAQP